jgi:putative ABC transport system substrate-binding protein
MKRREFVLAGGVSAASPIVTWAQTPQRVARIAFLTSAASDSRSAFKAFRNRLGDLGWTEGRSLDLKFYLAGGAGRERLDPMASQIAASGIDLVLADGRVATQAMAAASRVIPIVSIMGLDPTVLGLAESWARPGGNVTGLTMFTDLLNPKRLEVLREMVPSVKRVGVLYSSAGSASIHSVVEAGARLGLDMRGVFVDSLPDISRELSTKALADIDAIVVSTDGFLDAIPERVVAPINAALKPAVYPDRPYAEAGGMASYGVSLSDLFRRAATYVDRILRGEKPGMMPFERAERFELTLNMRTVRGLGLTLPPAIYARADEVIE